jgi:undecaprenyl-diphosphatase
MKNWHNLSASQLQDIGFGNIFSFVTALIAIRFFIQLVKTKGFAWFGYYRIAAGVAFLLYLYV